MTPCQRERRRRTQEREAAIASRVIGTQDLEPTRAATATAAFSCYGVLKSTDPDTSGELGSRRLCSSAAARQLRRRLRALLPTFVEVVLVVLLGLPERVVVCRE